MGLLNAIGEALKSILKRAFKFVVNFVKRFWWVILLVVLIYYAPALVLWAESASAPAWVVSGLKGLATFTPTVEGWLEAAMSAFRWVGGKWEVLGVWYKTAYIAGALFLLAPDEMKEVAREAAEEIGHGVKAVAEMAASVAGEVAKGVFTGLGLGNALLVGAGSFVAWWLFFKKDDDEDESVRKSERSAGHTVVVQRVGELAPANDARLFPVLGDHYALPL